MSENISLLIQHPEAESNIDPALLADYINKNFPDLDSLANIEDSLNKLTHDYESASQKVAYNYHLNQLELESKRTEELTAKKAIPELSQMLEEVSLLSNSSDILFQTLNEDSTASSQLIAKLRELLAKLDKLETARDYFQTVLESLQLS